MKTFTHIISNIEYIVKIGSNAKENWALIDNCLSGRVMVSFG